MWWIIYVIGLIVSLFALGFLIPDADDRHEYLILTLIWPLVWFVALCWFLVQIPIWLGDKVACMFENRRKMCKDCGKNDIEEYNEVDVEADCILYWLYL